MNYKNQPNSKFRKGSFRFVTACIILMALALGGSHVAGAFPPTGALPPLVWEGDRRVTQDTSGSGQNETHIGANPLNPDNAIVVTKDFRTGLRSRNYIDTTTDGGITWTEQLVPRPNPDLPEDIDPAVFFRSDGRAYVIWTSSSDFSHGGLFTSWSDDGGITWRPAVVVTPPEGYFDDKAWLAFDETGGPYNGTIYAFWTRFGNAEILSARSTDDGLTWSAPIQVSTGVSAINNDGAQPIVLPDGSLIVLFIHDYSPGIHGTFTIARSTDGGATFSPNIPLFGVEQTPLLLPGEIWRIFTYHSLVYDPARDALVMIWPDYRDGSSEGINILISRSADRGTSWTQPGRLNDDPPGIVRDQFFPSLALAPDGRLTAVWLDRRDDPANRLYHAYTRTSTDGGITWRAGERISSVPSNPNLNMPPDAGIGDYIGISSGPGVTWAAWTDVRNGNQDIYAARDLFTPQPTVTPTLTAVVPTSTPTQPTPSPTVTPICTISFSDVHPEEFFYEPVRYLFCIGAVSGYADGTFRPYSNTTRSQVVKIVVLAEGWNIIDPVTATFADVERGSTFYTFVETAVQRGIITGYLCGNPEPCDPQSRPVFRPFANVTRGQLTKIVVLAEGWEPINPPTPTFADVPPGSTFYTFIETAVDHQILSGYTCGNPEPCDPQSRPVFRPGNSATRGQIAKIIYNSVEGRP